MSADNQYPPLPPASALIALPVLLEKLQRLTTDAEHLKAGIYTTRLQVETIAESMGIKALKGHPGTSLQVDLPARDADTVEQLVDLLQQQHPGMSVDDCINDIFTTGLTATAHRLIPADTSE